MLPYIPITENDEKKMIDNMGIESVESLFDDIPDELRLKDRLNINHPMSEMEVVKKIKEIMKLNLSTEDLTCFLGAGAYDRYIPSVVNHLASRSEFYTAYTPYQPEISQGTLQCIFEYQSMISELTGMEVANASLYDGGTALVEASMMAVNATKRKKIIVSTTVNPDSRRILRTYCHFRKVEMIELQYSDGETDSQKLADIIDNTVAAVLVQSPNFFGIIEDLSKIVEITHNHKALLIMSADPISLAILKSPKEWGADIAVGEGQSLGSSLNFGGPYLGYMATNTKLMRKMPGRIVGESVDVDGKRAYVLTLQAREQHIRRDKATSNICSNEGLNALIAAIYLCTLGKRGLREVAEQSYKKAHYTMKKITESGKYKLTFNKEFFDEFMVSGEKDLSNLNGFLLEKGIIGGYQVGNDYDEIKNASLIAVTEKRTKEEIDNFVLRMEEYNERV